jgi:hypothetical protein
VRRRSAFLSASKEAATHVVPPPPTLSAWLGRATSAEAAASAEAFVTVGVEVGADCDLPCAELVK